MTVQLSKQEKIFIDNFLTENKGKNDESLLNYFFVFAIFSLLGIFMIVYTSILTINNMIDKVLTWVFFPGIISGLLLILTGFFIWQYHKKNIEKQKLVKIIEKLK